MLVLSASKHIEDGDIEKLIFDNSVTADDDEMEKAEQGYHQVESKTPKGDRQAIIPVDEIKSDLKPAEEAVEANKEESKSEE